MQIVNVGLVGITGYAGMELARLVASHPNMRLTMACSRAESGKRLGDYYPFLEHLPGADVQITVFDPREAAQHCELVFLAVPAGTAMQMVPPLLQAGVNIVDFSADFRIHDVATYERWYKLEHEAKEFLRWAVYGLPELYAKDITASSLVANPGCYPTSIILGLYAALKHKLVDTSDIVIDSKSGATGAGRKANQLTVYSEVADTFRAYGLPRHRHTPEIEQELSLIGHKDIKVLFTPHLVPMNRGILSTIYTKLKNTDMPIEEVHKLYCETWKEHPWVRILPLGKLPETRFVRGTMFCDIGLVMDPRTGRLVILSAIDNLCRGAAGQALANANLMSGLPVDAGLENRAAVM